MARIALETKGIEDVIRQLNWFGAQTKKIAEEALEAANDVVVKEAAKAVQKPNLPAGGKYSSGTSGEALRMRPLIEWQDETTAVAHVGFDIKKGALPTIFMMYGTPRYMKNQKLWDAFYGPVQIERIYKAQYKVFMDALEKEMAGAV